MPARLPTAAWGSIVLIGLAVGILMGALAEVFYRLPLILLADGIRVRSPDVPLVGACLGGLAGLAAAAAWCRIVISRTRSGRSFNASCWVAAALVGPPAGMVPHVGLRMVFGGSPDAVAASLILGGVFGLIAALFAGAFAQVIVQFVLRRAAHRAHSPPPRC